MIYISAIGGFEQRIALVNLGKSLDNGCIIKMGKTANFSVA
jgi:hypothetical protein